MVLLDGIPARATDLLISHRLCGRKKTETTFIKTYNTNNVYVIKEKENLGLDAILHKSWFLEIQELEKTVRISR